jgi:peptidyl-prolyl cis-trans isomerase C
MKSLAIKTASAAALAAAFTFGLQAADKAVPAPAPAKDAPKAAEAKQLTVEEKFAFLPDTVAEVGTTKISKQEFLNEVKPQIPQGALSQIPEDKTKEVAKKMVEGMVDKMVILKLVAKDGIKPSPELVKEEFDKMVKNLTPEQLDMFKKQIEFQGKTLDAYKEELAKDKNAQEGLAINRWIETNISSKVKVSDAEIEKYYRDNQAQFKTQDSITASHILIAPKVKEVAGEDAAAKKKAEADADAVAKKKAEDILAKLKQGADFEKLAEENSDCPSGKSAKGSLGEFSKDGQMVKEFEDAAFKLQPGQTSDLVKTQFGYHIIKVTARKPAGFVELDKVKPFIKDTLSGKAVDEALQKALQAEKDALKVKINV